MREYVVDGAHLRGVGVGARPGTLRLRYTSATRGIVKKETDKASSRERGPHPSTHQPTTMSKSLRFEKLSTMQRALVRYHCYFCGWN